MKKPLSHKLSIAQSYRYINRLVECGEGEQLSPDALSCEPIVTEEPTPVECPEGEQMSYSGWTWL